MWLPKWNYAKKQLLKQAYSGRLRWWQAIAARYARYRVMHSRRK